MPRPSLAIVTSAEDAYISGRYARDKWDATPTPIADSVSGMGPKEKLEAFNSAYPGKMDAILKVQGPHTLTLNTEEQMRDAEKIAQLARYGSTKRFVLRGLAAEREGFLRRDARLKKEDESDLLGLYRKPAAPEKDLIEFPSREKELEGLFGGRPRKSRKARGRKTRVTRKRKTTRRRS